MMEDAVQHADDEGRRAEPPIVAAKERIARRNAAAGRGIGDDAILGAPAPRPGPLADAVGGRLPPGQHLVSGFPVLDLGVQPRVTPERWKLQVVGSVPAREFDWDSFLALPQTQFVTDLHCVTTWSIFDSTVQGVRFVDLLPLLEVDSGCTHVTFHSYDDYTTNVPIEALLRADSALIHSWNGKPLTREHGAPVRAWIPRLYAWKSAKWIRKIEFMTADRPGFWEVRGYHDHADPWLEQRFSGR
ncbi:MAG: sulfite oxidase-like oxidoreductase [Planctomycetota bacterium]